ncbi:MAG: DnaD domain protein [Tissierellia bacterium]|nr:DnaD domain protein [Tissierellia bacterium]
MKAKLQKMTLDMGTTPIENIFINMIMPAMSAEGIKVYLTLLKASFDDEKIDLDSLINQVSIDKTREEILNELESLDLISMINYEGEDIIEITSIREKYFSNTIIDNSKEKSSANTYNQRQNMFDNIEKIIQRVLTPSEIALINETIDDYNVEYALVTEAFKQAKEKKNNVNPKYALAFVRNWRDRAIFDLKSLREYEKNNRTNNYEQKRKYKRRLYKPETSYEDTDDSMSITERFRRQRLEAYKKKKGENN